MTGQKLFIPSILTLPLLFPVDSGAALGWAKRSTDKKGNIAICNSGAAGGGEAAANQGKAPQVKPHSGPVASEQDPKTVRRRGLAKEQREMRQKAIMEKRDSFLGLADPVQPKPTAQPEPASTSAPPTLAPPRSILRASGLL
jgi:hypothetical protein